MTQPLKAKLVSMLEVVYPELDCDFLAGQLLTTMGLAPNQEPPPAHQNKTARFSPMKNSGPSRPRISALPWISWRPTRMTPL